MLVATYEGEHNHGQSPEREFIGNGSTDQAGSRPCSIGINSLCRTTMLDLTNQGSGSSMEGIARGVVTPEFHKLLVEKMVDSLKNDAEFMGALTSAVAEKVVERILDRL